MKKATAISMVLLFFVAFLNAETFVAPEKVGLSTKGVNRARQLLQHAMKERIAGSSVGLIARDGKIVFLEAFGELEPGTPMRTDAIVRMASIGKAITAVTILTLYEDNLLRLTDPVNRFIPEFVNLQVLVTENGSTRKVAAERDITIHDLLTHQAGLTSRGPELEHMISTIDAPGGNQTVQDFAIQMAALPLQFQPGTQFDYGFYGPGYDVLAAVAERASGKPFDVLVRDRVLKPLDMKDTFFHVPESHLPRLAAVYKKNAATGKLELDRKKGEEEIPNKFISGGGGLRGTVTDFYRFLQMILNGGEYNSKRILSPKTVQYMIQNHVENRFRSSTGDYGWGFGFAVRTRVIGDGVGTVGSLTWNGGTGTIYLVDPTERLIVILFVPSVPRTPGVSDLRDDFVTAAYTAIENQAALSRVVRQKP